MTPMEIHFLHRRKKGIISQDDVVELMAKIDAYNEEQKKKTEEEPAPEQETEPEENPEA